MTRHGTATTGPGPELWDRVDALVDRIGTAEAALDHRVGLLAARRWRATGRLLPAALREEERYTATAVLAAPVVLRRVAAAYPGPIAILKGLEIASRYPDPALRPISDLDLLVEDSAAAFRALVAAGATPLPHRRSPDHEPPLVFADLPLIVELHWAPKWPDGHAAPSATELLATAEPSRWLGERFLAPSPARHAVLLAAHAWAHRPLCRLGELVDVAALLGDCDRRECAAIARAWGVGRIWNATVRACDALFSDGALPLALRTWARNLPQLRHRSRHEMLLDRSVAPFAALPPHRALPVAAAAVAEMLRARVDPSGDRPEDHWPVHPSVLAARDA
jgi:hypothetical protein